MKTVMFRRVWTRTVALSLLAAATGCAPGKGSEVEDVPPEVRFDKLRFEVYRGPAIEATGTAGVARMRRDTGELAAQRVQVQFPPAAGREEAQLEAARGTGSATERWFQLEGGVVLVQGFTLDPDARTVRMAGGAALRTGAPTASASGGTSR